MKNPDPPAAPGAGDPGDAQEVDLDDADVSAEPVLPRVTAPPPLPPMQPSAPPVGSHYPSAPPPGPSFAPMPPQPSGRGPMFFVGILVAVLLVSVAAGTVIAFTRTKPSPKPAAAATSGPRVITIPVVDMDEPMDGGP